MNEPEQPVGEEPVKVSYLVYVVWSIAFRCIVLASMVLTLVIWACIVVAAMVGMSALYVQPHSTQQWAMIITALGMLITAIVLHTTTGIVHLIEMEMHDIFLESSDGKRPSDQQPTTLLRELKEQINEQLRQGP